MGERGRLNPLNSVIIAFHIPAVYRRHQPVNNRFTSRKQRNTLGKRHNSAAEKAVKRLKQKNCAHADLSSDRHAACNQEGNCPDCLAYDQGRILQCRQPCRKTVQRIRQVFIRFPEPGAYPGPDPKGGYHIMSVQRLFQLNRQGGLAYRLFHQTLFNILCDDLRNQKGEERAQNRNSCQRRTIYHHNSH